MRLGFSVAAHIQADVLLLDEVFAVGDEEFQRKCFGKIAEFKSRGGTIVFVSHDAAGGRAALRPRRAAAAAATSRSTAPTREAIAQYRRLLAGEREPGRARRRAARVGQRRGPHRRGAAARRRRRASGRSSPPASRSSSSSSSPPSRIVAPPRVSLELRDDAAVLVAGGAADGRRSAGARRGERVCASRSTRCRSPTGASISRCALVETRRRGCVHSLDDALASSSSRRRRDRAVLLEGRWSLQEIDAPRQSDDDELRTCPDWPRADGARAGAPVQALHAARGAAARRRARAALEVSTSTTSRSAATSTRTSSTPSTPNRASRARCAHRTGSTCASGSPPATRHHVLLVVAPASGCTLRPAANRRMPASSVAPIALAIGAPCVLGLLGFRAA